MGERKSHPVPGTKCLARWAIRAATAFFICLAASIAGADDSTTPVEVYVLGQHHDGGKADQILFRGFDSDHGTDFAVFVDGIPVNMVSHAHGQSYADRPWLIPETIARVENFKRPYFAYLDDFATSGAMNIITKRRDKESWFSISDGSYNRQRYLGVLSPPEATFLTPYLAFEADHNDGPFNSENNYHRYIDRFRLQR